MTTLDRRAALSVLLGGAAVAAGATLLASDAEAVTLPKLDAAPESLAEDAQYVVIGRRRRRRRCWWRRGRRYCSW